jgi:hypothetical protein
MGQQKTRALAPEGCAVRRGSAIAPYGSLFLALDEEASQIF